MRAIATVTFAVLAAGTLEPFSVPGAKSQPLNDLAPISDCDRGCERAAIQKAADRGYAEAQIRLGVMYINGKGVPQNYAEALKWFRKAADQRSAVGQYYLALMYDRGLGVPQNYTEAVNWFRKAAEQGNAEAQTSLGNMYVFGQGVPQNFTAAANWYRRAADQGNADGQYFLGLLYETGKGMPQNYSEAMNWYRKAAEQGDPYAQEALGGMYETSRGVPQNYVRAYMWINLAASRFDAIHNAGQRDKAIKRRNLIASLMSPAQIAEAQRLARVCLQNNYKECGVDRPRIARRDEGAPPPAKREVASTGTGFFVSESGHILTPHERACRRTLS